MARFLASDPQERATEELLQATFQERAPATIEVDHSWAAVSGRLALVGQKQRPARTSVRQSLGLGGSYLARRRRALIAVAAVLLLPILLLGAGYVKEHYLGTDPGTQRIEDEHLYTDIGQRQEADGITVTITHAYADEGRTEVFYAVLLSPELEKRYHGAFLIEWSLTDQQGAEPSGGGGLGTCTGWNGGDGRVYCTMIEGPFHPAAGVNQLIISLNVVKVALMGSSPHDMRTGPWDFQFALPFHQMNIGSVEQFFPHLLHLHP
jgi:hypothetical protein